jgi:hypothetical protein
MLKPPADVMEWAEREGVPNTVKVAWNGGYAQAVKDYSNNYHQLERANERLNRKCEEAWTALEEIRDSTNRHPMATGFAHGPFTVKELIATIDYMRAIARTTLEHANRED